MPINWYTWQQFLPEKSMTSTPGCPENVPASKPYHDTNVHNATYPVMPALDAFGPACRQLYQAGGYVNAFVPAKLYDPGLYENGPFAAQAKPNTVRDLQGKLVIGWQQAVWRMC